MMDIDHIHFYVENLAVQREWFLHTMGCQVIGETATSHTATAVLKNGAVYFVLSAALSPASPVAQYLKKYPSGVADIAFRVPEIEPILANADQVQVPLQNSSRFDGALKWAKIAGWGSLSHTLIENTSTVDFCCAVVVPDAEGSNKSEGDAAITFTQIDHVVLNVPTGALIQAVEWYQHLLGFQVQQAFQIQTQHSGLNSKVLKSPGGEVYFNINEPSCARSQIQVFLDENRGSGIQHIALKTPSILQVVGQMRQRGMAFLSVPTAYYAALRARLQQGKITQFLPQVIQDIEAQNILVDWQADRPGSILLQIFSHPIFEQRTFFLS